MYNEVMVTYNALEVCAALEVVLLQDVSSMTATIEERAAAFVPVKCPVVVVETNVGALVTLIVTSPSRQKTVFCGTKVLMNISASHSRTRAESQVVGNKVNVAA